MIMVSLGMLEGSYVTEGLCNATNEWQCELYQSDVEHYIPTLSVGGGSWQSEQASGFGSGPYDFGEGRISPEFSCGRYQIIEPAGLEQCNQMAANLVGSVKACYYDDGSDTCYAGAGPHDEAHSVRSADRWHRPPGRGHPPD